jgi:threonine synthase
VEVEAGSRRVLAKVEGTLPSGSFKDRGAATLVGWLAASGVRHAVADSSGNAGAAIAAACARAGIALDLYVPAAAAAAKLAQAEAAGARVVRVDGPRQAAADAAREAAAAGAAYASHAWSPFFLAGTRGFARELEGQLGGPPDALVVPCGSGTLLLGAALELAGAPTRLYAVQSAACAPLAGAFAAGADGPVHVEPQPSAAEGVLVARPPRGREILAAVRASGGAVIALGDEVLPAALAAAVRAGLFCEPSAALGLAGAAELAARGLLAPRERVVVALTGHGLKAPGLVADLVRGA